MKSIFRVILAAILLASFLLPERADAQPLPEQAAVAKIEAKGGRVYRNAAGQVDMVSMTGDQVTNADLELLQSLPALRNLNLDGKCVTDPGLDQLQIGIETAGLVPWVHRLMPCSPQSARPAQVPQKPINPSRGGRGGSCITSLTLLPAHPSRVLC